MRTSHKSVIVIGLALTAFLAIPLTAAAQPMFSLTPKVAASWRFDDNFYKAETNEREVHTWVVQPGIEAGFEAGKTTVDLDYTLDVYEYDDRDAALPGSSQAENEDYTGHDLSLKAETQPFARLGAGLDVDYRRTRDAAASDPLSNSTDRAKFDVFGVSPSLTYEFGARFNAGLRYENKTTDYTDDALEDNTIHRGVFDLVYNLGGETSLDLEYQYWTADYSQATSDYDSNQGKLILRHEFSVFSIEGGAGYHHRSFEQAGLADIDGGVYHLELGADTGKTTASLKSEWNYNDNGGGDVYFKNHKLSLDVGHTFMERLLVGVGASWMNADYENLYAATPAGTLELRDEDTYTVDASVGYELTRWLTVSLETGYEERDSNHAGRDYENTWVFGEFAVVYPLGE